MAVNTDPAEYKMNPVLVAMIAQARVIPTVEEEQDDEPDDIEPDGDGA